MKAVKLHTAAVDNGGARRDAGEILTVGDQPRQISSDRASDLVGKAAAVAQGAAAKAPAKPTAKKAAKPKSAKSAANVPTPPAPPPAPPVRDVQDGAASSGQ